MRRIRRLAAFYFFFRVEKGRDPCPTSKTRRFRAEVFLLPLVSLLLLSLRFVSQRREDAGRFVTVARARARAGEPELT